MGKTQICDFLFLYNTVKQVIDDGLDIKLKIFYFSLEMTKEEKMRSAFSNILFLKEGVMISPKDLKSTKGVLPEEVVELIEKHQVYFDAIEEIVTFIDDVRNPTGIYKMMTNYAKDNGTIHTKTIHTKSGDKNIFDHYEPKDPEEYVMCIVDHIALIIPDTIDGRKLSLYDSITLLSSNYFVRLRNMYNYIPVAIQQQASSQESVENAKANKLKPSLDGLGDNKTTQRDANVILGLFSPFRHEIAECYGYDVTFFKDNIRFLEILGGREGGAGVIAPLYFNGAVNYFKELPLPTAKTAMSGVSKFVNRWRNYGKE